jgi:hypothetical protein
MADICQLILDEHEEFRRGFAALDELRARPVSNDKLRGALAPLAAHLDRHADAEERHFYPALLRAGRRAQAETNDAIADHNDIRDALRRASAAEPGSSEWWDGVNTARESNSDHMAEEERGAIADFRTSADPASRAEIGAAWIAFIAEHPGREGIDETNKEPGDYIAEHERR